MKNPFYVGEFQGDKNTMHILNLPGRYNLLIDRQKDYYIVLSLGLLELGEWIFCHSENIKYIPVSVLGHLQPKLVFSSGNPTGKAWHGGDGSQWTSRPQIMGYYDLFHSLYPEHNIPPEMFNKLMWTEFGKFLYIPSMRALEKVVWLHYSFKGDFIYYNIQ